MNTVDWIRSPASTDAKADAPVLQPPDMRSRLIGQDPGAGKEGQGEEGGRGWDG